MRVIRCGCDHRHVAFDAVNHHDRTVKTPGQRLSGLPLGFNQQELIYFRDTVTSSLHTHGGKAVVYCVKPRHSRFLTVPVVNALPAFFAQSPRQHQFLLHQRRRKRRSCQKALNTEQVTAKLTS